MPQYKHQVVKLTKRSEANGLADVITSVCIHYIASENGKQAVARCTMDFDVPQDASDFVAYQDVTQDMMIEWSKKRIDYNKFNPDLERQLREQNQVEEINFQ